jgi:Sec-independent protein translocase protein TatA
VVNKWIKEYKNNMEKEEEVAKEEKEEEGEELAILKEQEQQAYDREGGLPATRIYIYFKFGGFF